MIFVYYTQFSIPFPKEKWTTYFQQMPNDIQQRIYRYRRTENQYQLLLGRMLLQYGMKELGFDDFKLSAIFYDEVNYPLWKGDVNFNIAHSGNIVACIFSKNTKVGIDVEKIKKINLNNFDYILNKIDHDAIAKSSNPHQVFFKIWTIKEAVTKAIGKGLTIDVQQIQLFDKYAILDKKQWYYQKLNFKEGFAAHLVSSTNGFDKLKIQEVVF